MSERVGFPTAIRCDARCGHCASITESNDALFTLSKTVFIRERTQ